MLTIELAVDRVAAVARNRIRLSKLLIRDGSRESQAWQGDPCRSTCSVNTEPPANLRRVEMSDARRCERELCGTDDGYIIEQAAAKQDRSK